MFHVDDMLYDCICFVLGFSIAGTPGIFRGY